MTTMKSVKWSTALPLILLAYLGFMAYIGYPHLLDGEYLFYFGIVGISLVIILALHIVLRKKEQLRKRASEDIYATYAEVDDENAQHEKSDTDHGNAV